MDAASRDKLDQYRTSIREVERKLQMTREWSNRPKPAASIEPVRHTARRQVDEIPLFLQLITLALQADSTRVVTLEIYSILVA